MRNKRVILVLTLLAWLFTAGWLIRYEAFPGYFSRTLAGYKEMLSGDLLMSDSWMLITFNDEPIGFSHTSMETDEDDPVFYYTVKNEMELKLPLMGEQHDIDVDTTAHLDVMHQLQKFTFMMSTKASDTEFRKKNLFTMKAIRRKNNAFHAAIVTPTSTRRAWIDIPPDTVIHSPMTEMALKKLKPGQSMSIRTLEPSTFSTTLINVKAVKKELLTIGTNTFNSTQLQSEYQGASVNSWIDEDGSILKQETPFGWNMVRCTPEEALNAVLGDSPVDILRAMSVPLEGTITDPRQSERAVYRLTGVLFTREEIESFRQMVDSIEGEDAVLTVWSGDSDTRNTRHVTRTDEKDLEATIYVQSDNKKLIAAAQKITSGLNTSREKADALYEWVYRNVKKEMTVSLPSSLDVLNTMSGDCNEHTYLFVGLARSIGLPAKIKVGLAYHEDSFYYHAWPAVYTDRWVEMDPTWGQKFVDATHIAFAEGEIADQLGIVKLLGQLKIEILKEGSE